MKVAKVAKGEKVEKVAKRRPGRPPKSVALKKDKKPEVQVQVQEVSNDHDPNGKSVAVNGSGSARNHIAELEERVRDRVDSWETESLYEDAIEGLAEETSFPDDGKSQLVPQLIHLPDNS